MDSDFVNEFIRREIPYWDDEVVATARFKAFSGQRFDWEPKFQFWRSLILKVSRQFGAFIIDLVQVKNEWFDRRGMTSLCIDHVLVSFSALSHLSECGKAHKISINRGELIEGIKVSISQAALSSISTLDCDILHLLRTTEKLQDQLEVMDQRCET